MQEIYTLQEVLDFIKGKKMAFLYLYANNCTVCKVLEPKIEEMLGNFPSLESRRVNMEKMIELSGTLNVFIVPVALLFTEGNETLRMARNISIADLEGRINRYYELLTERN